MQRELFATGIKSQSRSFKRCTLLAPSTKKLCAWCGIEFWTKPSAPHQVYCCKKHKSAGDKRREAESTSLARCVYCGKTFKPKRKYRATFCSQQCSIRYIALSRFGEPKAVLRAKILGRLLEPLRNLAATLHRISECEICGKRFIARLGSIYCSETCRRKGTCDKGRINKGTRLCYQCHKEFDPAPGSIHWKYCSDKCRNKFTRRNQRRAREAREWGTASETFSDKSIFERDGYLCCVCGMPVRTDVRPCHYQAATIDHIIPLSRGGSNMRGNIQTVHFICNSIKSNRLPSEMVRVTRGIKKTLGVCT